MDQNIVTNTRAVPARPTSACNPRVFKSTASAEAPLVVIVDSAAELACAAAPEVPADEAVTTRVLNEPVAVKAPVAETEVIDIVLRGTEAEVVTASVTLGVLLPAEVLATVEPLRYVGAATADDASTRAPVPHWMPSVVSVGSVVDPSEAEIVQRPVHVRFVGSAGDENW